MPKKNMKLIAATNNQHKLQEIANILKGKFEVCSLAEAGISCNPEENGSTFEQNAIIKANAVGQLCNCCVLADDTGLCVDALDGMPGVHSARFAASHDDAANRRKLLQLMQGKCNRKAHFECVVALRYPNGQIVCASGKVEGEILPCERGENGFGYDSVFFCHRLGKTFAQASEEEKNAISHRGNAIKALLEKI